MMAFARAALVVGCSLALLPSHSSAPGRVDHAVEHRPVRIHMRTDFRCWDWRICGAMRRFAPAWVEWVASPRLADVEIIHVDEASKFSLHRARTYLKRGAKSLVIIQHSLGFTNERLNPNLVKAWSGALFVATWQDLNSYHQSSSARSFEVLELPWGANPDKFRPPGESGRARQDHVVAVSTFHDHESMEELLIAAAHTNVRVRHIGAETAKFCNCTSIWSSQPACTPRASLGGKAACSWHDALGRLSDAALVHELQTAKWASALRKFEGFEMVGIEALFCGARPLVYDLPSYRWDSKYALVVSSLLVPGQFFSEVTEYFKAVPSPVSEEELASLRSTFSWDSIMARFFEHLKNSLDGRAKTGSLALQATPVGAAASRPLGSSHPMLSADGQALAVKARQMNEVMAGLRDAPARANFFSKTSAQSALVGHDLWSTDVRCAFVTLLLTETRTDATKYAAFIEVATRVRAMFKLERQYPWVVFHSEPIKPTHETRLRESIPSVIFRSLEAEWHAPPWAPKRSEWNATDRNEGYRHMCRFFATRCFSLMGEMGFDAFMRIDDDVFFLQPVG